MKKIVAIGILFGIFLYSCVHEPLDGDSFSDPTPYVFPTPAGFPPPNLPADNPLTVEGIELGRRLFYDPILSADSSISCGSCHAPNAAFSDTARFSKGIRGQIGYRQSMPLFNLAWVTEFLWDGRASSLRKQIHFPIEDPIEMGERVENVVKKLNQQPRYQKMFKKAFQENEVTDTLMFKAIEQFLLTMISADSKFDQWRRGEVQLSQQELYGLQIFEKEIYNTTVTDVRLIPPPPGTLVGADCFHCHGNRNNPFLSNNFGYQNNGLDAVPADSGRMVVTKDPSDFGKFKTPTLRNWGFTAPYMHDGRFQTIDQVLDHYEKPNPLSPNIDPGSIGKSATYGLRLRLYERAALKAFLNTLNDTAFTTDQRYQNPFR